MVSSPQNTEAKMTKDDAVQLGVASQEAKDIFRMHCEMNTRIDPAERAAQVLAFERARATMHEAMNRHHEALRQLGLLPSGIDHASN